MATTPPTASQTYSALLSALTGTQRDAATAVLDVFSQYGLQSLAPKIVEYVKNGYSADTASLLLQDTPEYQARFSGNAARIKAGLPALTPSQYLATETAYNQTMQKWGLPNGFYNTQADFANLIAADVSPAELDQRAKDASDFINRANPNELAFFKQHYTSGDMIAYALDPTRAEPLIGKAFQSAEIGGQAQQQGITITQQQAEALAGTGVTADGAMKGFGMIAADQPIANRLAAIYGDQPLTTNDLIQATFNAGSQQDQELKKMASQERASFGGSTGINAAGNSLSSNTNAPV